MTDAELIASAICKKIARWEYFSSNENYGEICFNGLRYATNLDDNGIPVLNDLTRARLQSLLERKKP